MEMSKIHEWIKLIRDIGLILGVPTIIGIGMSLHNKQVDALKAQLALAESTRYDRALSIIEAQKKLHSLEFEEVKNRYNRLSEDQKKQVNACLPFQDEAFKDLFVSTGSSILTKILLDELVNGANKSNKSIQPDAKASAD